MEQNAAPKQRTATQRLDDLERAMMALYQTADSMARDLMTLKDAIKILGNKTDAMVKASLNGEQMTDAVLTRIMVENNVTELQEKVTNLINQGILVKGESVNSNSFIVGREVNDKGEVVNPRLQFTLGALTNKDLQEKITSSKSGDVLELKEGSLKFEVLEVYDIVQAPPATNPGEAQQESANA